MAVARSRPVQLTPFTKMVIKRVKQIPLGKVATYSQIAALAGKPHGARGVGWILNACARSHRLPWQRVINAQGRISFHRITAEFREQKKLLLREGVHVTRDGDISLESFGWQKKPAKVKAASSIF